MTVVTLAVEPLSGGSPRRWLAPGATLLWIVAMGAFASGAGAGTITEMMIRMVVVVGIYVFVGNSGIISFGHISFMSIGAYAAAWLVCCTLPMVKPMYLPGLPEWLQNTAAPFWVGIIAAACLSGLVSLVVGVALMRLSGIAASIATFGVLAVQFNIYTNWDTVTAGTSSISNLPISVSSLTASLFAVMAIVIAAIYQNSRHGLMLRAIRDDEVAAKAAGIKVVRARLIAFVLSAVTVGTGGALHSGFLGMLTVDSFYLQQTFITLTMLIVGGVSSLTGAIVGVVFVTAITFALRGLEGGVMIGSLTIRPPVGFQEVGLGVVLVMVMIFRTGGLTRGWDMFRFPPRRRP
jgi:branched-chain amino acid transport system permease protein